MCVLRVDGNKYRNREAEIESRCNHKGDVEYRMNIKRLVHLQDYYQDLAELVRFEKIELPKGLTHIPDGYMYGFKKEAE